ncbi:hypothetical protein AB833_29810 [Chromatiales bacterium (ex Bugula neritina AB1)]|nr:hypothetical protein AB833_29810 [Chromatiales bacterium (ex Bugula neritina AB1)]
MHLLNVTQVIANGTLRLLSFMPLSVLHHIGNLIGRSFQILPNRHRRIIQRNLELCYPDLTVVKRNEFAASNLRETGKNLTELGALWRWSKPKIEALVVEEVNKQHLQSALNENKGVIIAAPHTGAWELIGLKLTCDQPMHFLYRPNRRSQINSTILQARERFGGKCHPITRRGLSALVRALKNGELIGILPDQEPAADHGVFAPFFGLPAYTMTFLSNLAQKTDATVVFAVMERLPAAAGYRLHYLQPDKEIYDEDPEVSSAALNRCIEQCIAIAPTQYMWSYKRFKAAPSGIESRY